MEDVELERGKTKQREITVPDGVDDGRSLGCTDETRGMTEAEMVKERTRVELNTP